VILLNYFGERLAISEGILAFLLVGLCLQAWLASWSVQQSIRLGTRVDDQGKLYRKMIRNFAQYFSPKVAELLSGLGPGALAEGRREISVIFADLSGFTRFSEKATADAVVDTLQEYFDELTQVVFRNEGSVDKYIGDEMMVVFNAPTNQPDHAVRAMNTVRDMQTVIRLLNTHREARGLPTLQMAIGVNSGEVVVGHVGGRRVEYTVIGDTVNVAKRLQGLAMPGEVVIGERTLELAAEPFSELESHPLKGRVACVRCMRLKPLEAEAMVAMALG